MNICLICVPFEFLHHIPNLIDWCLVIYSSVMITTRSTTVLFQFSSNFHLKCIQSGKMIYSLMLIEQFLIFAVIFGFFLRKLQHNHRQTMVYLNAIMCCRLWICFFSYMYLKIKFSQHLRKKGSEIFQIIVFSFLHDCL